jgi:hypothetical protein
VLSPAVTQALNALREIESDYPEYSSEETLNYLFKSVLNTVYAGGGYRSTVESIGVLESTKLEFYAKLNGEL